MSNQQIYSGKKKEAPVILRYLAGNYQSQFIVQSMHVQIKHTLYKTSAYNLICFFLYIYFIFLTID